MNPICRENLSELVKIIFQLVPVNPHQLRTISYTAIKLFLKHLGKLLKESVGRDIFRWAKISLPFVYIAFGIPGIKFFDGKRLGVKFTKAKTLLPEYSTGTF
jgi:hypothetical protein